MKTVFALMLTLFLSESVHAQSNVLFPGETKLIRTYGQRKIKVTCVDTDQQGQVFSEVGFFRWQDCVQLSHTLEMSGDPTEDGITCSRYMADSRLGYGSVSFNGKCRNLQTPGTAVKHPNAPYACTRASELIRENLR